MMEDEQGRWNVRLRNGSAKSSPYSFASYSAAKVLQDPLRPALGGLPGDGEGQIPDFSIEKRAAQKPAQTPPPQRPTGLQRNSARVLTGKKGVFWQL
jgi:hypothetical protein